MSRITDIESRIADAASVYSDFKRNVLRLFAGFLVSPDQRPVDKGRLRAELEAVSRRYQEQFSTALVSSLEFVLGEAMTLTTDGDSPLDEAETDALAVFVDTLIERADQSIRYQMRADVESLVQTYGRFLMRVELIQRKKGYSRTSAIIAERDRALRALELYRRDALGRKRDSEQFVMVELHHVAYRLFNVCMVWVLSLHGEDKALIHRPGHALDGLIFDLEDYDAMENEVFHPNAQALVYPLNTQSAVSMV